MAEDIEAPEEQDQNAPSQTEDIEATPQRVPAPEPTIVTNAETPEEPAEPEPQTDIPSTETPATNTADSKKWEDGAKVAQETHKERFAKLKDFFHGYWAKKKWTLPVTVLVLILIVLAVPFTRYKVLGLFWKHDVTVSVVDSVTTKPVSGATVEAGGKSGATNGEGKLTLHLAVGPQKLTVSKKYYKNGGTSVTIGLFGSQAPAKVSLVATGRQVPITVTNKLTGKGLAGVHLLVLGTNTQTDKNGKATLVLPTTSGTQKLDLTLAGYNALTTKVQVTDQAVAANNFVLTPSGKLYFLSNLSGTIDVVKTNLDGSARQTVLAGTGKEDPYTTALLASRDWKYLALLSKRDGNQGVYLINTSNDNVTNIDGGSSTATFTLVGWSDDIFVYQVNRSDIQSWQSGAQALKSYDANSGKLYSLDQTQGEGTSQTDYAYTSFGTVSIFDNELVYTKSWYNALNHSLAGKNDNLFSAKPNGSSKQDVKDFPVPASNNYGYIIDTVAYEPYGVYIRVPNSDNTNTYYEYTNGKVTQQTDITDDIYSKPYPTFLESPSGAATFWSEVRDNKNALFVGNENGASPKTIATLSDYTPYGWYSDNYLLVTKNGSELFIMPNDGSSPPVKISDYYKPQLTFNGYGGGYGGL